MATSIVYHQIEVNPATAADDFAALLPGVEVGQCQVVGAEFIGGGADKRFLLHVIVLGPADEPEEQAEDGAS